MPSYQPKYVYGAITDLNGRWTGKYGLKPWPKHLRTQINRLAAMCVGPIEGPTSTRNANAGWNEPRVDAPVTLAESGGEIVLTLSAQNRTSIEDAVEKLISLLDTTEPDPDLEPNLGFVGVGTGWRSGETLDDREQTTGSDDDRELDQAEHGIADADALHSEEFMFREWDGDGSGDRIAKAMLSTIGKRKQPTVTEKVILFRRDDPIIPPRYMTSDPWTGNLPPEAFESFIPEISMHRMEK